MSQDNKQFYHSAGLLINLSTGEVTNSKQKLRLSPVNTRVLAMLLTHVSKAVTRQQLFDGVWPNQVVSDDALTRSISDLRAQLRTLTTTDPLIETIPKVGYRWLATVVVSDEATVDSVAASESVWSQHLKPILVALALLVASVWALLGWLYYGSTPNATALIILPTEYLQNTTSAKVEPTVKQADVAVWLKQAVMQHHDMRYLSGHALDSHVGSPFPFYSHEFGVRWFIESQITQSNQQFILTLNLVDARTALVIYSQRHPFQHIHELKTHCQNFMAFVATL